MLAYFILGQLPWREVDFSNSGVSDIIKYKSEILNSQDIPIILQEYMIYVKKLEFKEKPNYELFIHKFKNTII
jgi:hypothetical protein